MARQDRRTWFEDAVVELLPELMGAAPQMTEQRPDAEDLVAEAVARAWARRADLADPGRFRGWMFRILTNLRTDRLRSERARPPRETLPLEVDPAAGRDFSLFERLHQPFLLWRSSPEVAFIDRLLREDLEGALAALPETFRVVVVLADVQGFTYREIADTLGIPIGTVRSRLARGRSRLQERLWHHAVDAGWRNEPDGSDQPERHSPSTTKGGSR